VLKKESLESKALQSSFSFSSLYFYLQQDEEEEVVGVAE
jgi:hypothetical protein